MRIIRYTLAAVLMLGMASCSVTAPIARQGYTAKVAHTPKQMRIEAPKSSNPGYVEIKHDDRPSEFIVQTKMIDGEQVMCMTIDEVTVVAKSRSLPERLGKVDVDFVVTLPKQLQGSCRSVVVTPVLHNNGKKEPLQDLTIRGQFFSKVQARDYWQFSRFKEVYNPDSLRSALAFGRFVKYPYPVDVRLDKVVEHAADVSYHYRQEVPTAEAGKRLKITLDGYVTGLDGSRCRLAPSDTVEYNISSMLTFVDTATRYVTRIVEKYAQVRDKNYLAFRVNDTRILDTLGDNRTQLGRIGSLMDRLVNQSEFYVDSIVLTASSSPEGTFTRNAQLARERAHALRQYLCGKFPDGGVDTIIRVRSVAEDWTELARLVENDPQIKEKEKILHLWKQFPDPDRREAELRKRFPAEYKHIRADLYPLLRSVSFQYDLRRVGMIKDTIHTTEPDTLYGRGVQLMQERKYAQALYILSDYKDRNTAVVLLSLGHDDPAYEILCTLPESATTQYLKAIALARLGRRAEALEAYDRSVELDERMQYRSGLDPELNDLLKHR